MSDVASRGCPGAVETEGAVGDTSGFVSWLAAVGVPDAAVGAAGTLDGAAGDSTVGVSFTCGEFSGAVGL